MHTLPPDKSYDIHALRVVIGPLFYQFCIVFVCLVADEAAAEGPELFPVEVFRHLEDEISVIFLEQFLRLFEIDFIRHFLFLFGGNDAEITCEECRDFQPREFECH